MLLCFTNWIFWLLNCRRVYHSKGDLPSPKALIKFNGWQEDILNKSDSFLLFKKLSPTACNSNPALCVYREGPFLQRTLKLWKSSEWYFVCKYIKEYITYDIFLGAISTLFSEWQKAHNKARKNNSKPHPAVCTPSCDFWGSSGLGWVSFPGTQ